MATLIHKSGSSELWQGGIIDLAYPEKYETIVLCAEEIQADDSQRRAFGKTHIISAPNDDSGTPFSTEQATVAVKASFAAAKDFRAGKRVLISCAQGRNRSGLVMALTLHHVLGITGREATQVIRDKIPSSLANQWFVDFLKTVE